MRKRWRSLLSLVRWADKNVENCSNLRFWWMMIVELSEMKDEGYESGR